MPKGQGLLRGARPRGCPASRQTRGTPNTVAAPRPRAATVRAGDIACSGTAVRASRPAALCAKAARRISSAALNSVRRINKVGRCGRPPADKQPADDQRSPWPAGSWCRLGGVGCPARATGSSDPRARLNRKWWMCTWYALLSTLSTSPYSLSLTWSALPMPASPRVAALAATPVRAATIPRFAVQGDDASGRVDSPVAVRNQVDTAPAGAAMQGMQACFRSRPGQTV